ncbi:hypothetical protein BGW36DRAFT_430423 [Talaromyces proteolyticus]|uniref:Uncharacterized protein n=1 Tax=Talaromyces proteolyticus TaxID=1131652 RepID=A0AAD4PUV8_9EURO|nr:uncharacterized protein BGW36DRAFT_430423 [Talaromyces proteolyticus]KAH8692669.1 hypothetical protein BGW36DRAFT_430423 [Talaromyces proteolyticus]
MPTFRSMGSPFPRCRSQFLSPPSISLVHHLSTIPTLIVPTPVFYFKSLQARCQNDGASSAVYHLGVFISLVNTDRKLAHNIDENRGDFVCRDVATSTSIIVSHVHETSFRTITIEPSFPGEQWPTTAPTTFLLPTETFPRPPHTPTPFLTPTSWLTSVSAPISNVSMHSSMSSNVATPGSLLSTKTTESESLTDTRDTYTVPAPTHTTKSAPNVAVGKSGPSAAFGGMAVALLSLVIEINIA